VRQLAPRPHLGVLRAPAGLLACAVATAALAGCGLGAGNAPSAVRLTVTDDFGARPVRSWSAPKVAGQETVMSLLLRNANVGTRYGGAYVSSIEGVGEGEASGQPASWFYYVNGIEGSKGAAATTVHSGDRIWWDRHAWSQTDSVPAVVGSFPEPFLDGIAGRRYPVRVECEDVSGDPCQTVVQRLREAGVPARPAAITTAGDAQTLRVLVGRWSAVDGAPGAQGLARGPRASGVYARFSADGHTLTLLDARGDAARRLGAGGGLIAAVRPGEQPPLWFVTGTDRAGVSAAARAFQAPVLDDRFAVAVTPAGSALGLPVSG